MIVGLEKVEDHAVDHSLDHFANAASEVGIWQRPQAWLAFWQSRSIMRSPSQWPLQVYSAKADNGQKWLEV